METIGSLKCTIPLDDLVEAEDIAFSMLQMDREAVMENFDDVYEDTLAASRESVECRALFQGFPVESIQDGVIRLAGGVELQSPELASLLHRADEVVLYAVTAAGSDELINDLENDVFETMFYNAWGAGYSLAAHAWIKRAIAERASAIGAFAGRGWAPGEGAIEARLQTVLFETLDPSQIGITLIDTVHMTPMMTVTGIMGVSADPAIQADGADRVLSH